MKCPGCGEEIPDGQLICEHCGTEIKIVPNYESDVDEKIRENLSRIRAEVGKETAQDERTRRAKEEKAHRMRKLRFVLAGMLLGVLLVAGIAAVFQYNRLHSQSYYVGMAYKASQDGDYGKAAELIASAIAMDTRKDPALLLTEADYQFKADQKDAAMKTLQEIISDSSMTKQDVIAAWQKIIDDMAADGDYEGIASMLAKSGDEEVTDYFSEYLTYDPEIDTPSGSYEPILHVTLSDQGSGSIFYTLDGSRPDENSFLYKSPVELPEGTYEISAIAINKYGVAGHVVRRMYTVGTQKPEAPVITTASGTYHSPTMIKAEDPKEGKIYYTTDGTDPTQDSALYTSPISMPYGNTTYRFAVILDSGSSSDIVECNYSYAPTGSVSIENGPNYIIVALIKRGEIMAVDGTVSGGTARYEYSYKGSKNISGYGNFYIYDEILVDNAGNSALTGRRFAVNISNGTVNLYADDGTLTPVG